MIGRRSGQTRRATVPPARRGAAGLALTGLSLLLAWIVALLGPSVMEPALPGRPGQPPWAFAAHPSPYLVVTLAALSLAAGTAGLALAMHAARAGWVLPPALLVTAGIVAAVAFALVPPFGSSDHLNYAAYGRIASIGRDPYTMTPAALARLGDPVGRAVRQFRTSPSVYGALATAGQLLASRLGGTSVRLTVFVLSLLNAVAFIGTGLLLHWLTRGDQARQFRAALLWTANPLMLQVLVGGAHADSQAVVFAVGGVAAFAATRLAGQSVGNVRRSAELARGPGTALPAAFAGVLIGLGFAVKVTMSLAGAGIAAACLLAWLARRRLADPVARREPVITAAWLAAGFAVTAGGSLAFWGVSSLTPALKAGSYVSNGSPWRTVRVLLALVFPRTSAEDAVKLAAVAFGVFLLAWLLRSVTAWPGGWPAIGEVSTAGPEGSGQAPEGRSADSRPGRLPTSVPVLNLAIWLTFAIVFAWLFSWPYVLPWYDAAGWALIALLPWSVLDWLLLARTCALAFGYLTASGAPVPGGLTWLETVVRTAVTPAVLLACTVLLMLATRRARIAGR